MIERRQVEVGGQRISYEVAGQGDPAVLLHGLSGSTRWWRRTIPALAGRYRLYLVDLPGFGAMRGHAASFVLRDAAHWLYRWMQAINLPRAHVVGHSMGGYIALRLAADYPIAVARLVLVDPVGAPINRSVFGQMLPLLAEGLHFSPAFLPILLHDALRAGPRTLWRATTALLGEDARAAMRAVQAPTLLIWGGRDHLVPVSLSFVLCAEIPHASLHIIKQAHHVPMFERPGEFNRVLADFLH